MLLDALKYLFEQAQARVGIIRALGFERDDRSFPVLLEQPNGGQKIETVTRPKPELRDFVYTHDVAIQAASFDELVAAANAGGGVVSVELCDGTGDVDILLRLDRSSPKHGSRLVARFGLITSHAFRSLMDLCSKKLVPHATFISLMKNLGGCVNADILKQMTSVSAVKRVTSVASLGADNGYSVNFETTTGNIGSTTFPSQFWFDGHVFQDEFGDPFGPSTRIRVSMELAAINDVPHVRVLNSISSMMRVASVVAVRSLPKSVRESCQVVEGSAEVTLKIPAWRADVISVDQAREAAQDPEQPKGEETN